MKTDVPALYFTPEAIREACDRYDDDDARKAWVNLASDETLGYIGEACLSSVVLWQVFYALVEVSILEAMRVMVVPR